MWESFTVKIGGLEGSTLLRCSLIPHHTPKWGSSNTSSVNGGPSTLRFSSSTDCNHVSGYEIRPDKREIQLGMYINHHHGFIWLPDIIGEWQWETRWQWEMANGDRNGNGKGAKSPGLVEGVPHEGIEGRICLTLSIIYIYIYVHSSIYT